VTNSSKADTSIEALLSDGLAAHRAVIDRCASAFVPEFSRLVSGALETYENGGKLVFFGNGGSAADAQHIAAELTIRFTINRRALAAIALTTDTSALTACANDFGFDQVFARQVEALVKPKDTVIGISTSGCSKNVLLGLASAKKIGAKIFAFTGESGGDMNEMCCATLRVPSRVTARIQEVHILLGHLLCEAIETKLFSAPQAI